MSEENDNVYNIVLTVPSEINGEILPAGSVINVIVWDGKAPYRVEDGTRLELARP